MPGLLYMEKITTSLCCFAVVVADAGIDAALGAGVAVSQAAASSAVECWMAVV